jgi:DNA-3-methyladenine glycosylase II
MINFSFQLKPKPPFRLDLTAWALRRRPDNAVDRWDGRTYGRVLVINGRPFEIEVTQTGTLDIPGVQIAVTGPQLSPRLKSTVTSTLERMLGFRTDLSDFYSFARRDKKLWELSQRFLGLKPPRFPDLFEALANGFSCQQLSLSVGIILLSRLAMNYGVPFQKRDSIVYSFALPDRLARSEVQALRSLGFSRNKGRFLIELAQKVTQETPDLNRIENLDNEATLKELYQLRGVGRWTAEYVLLRGMGRLHVFPADDIGARNKLKSIPNLRKPLDNEGVNRILGRWKPYGGFVYIHLLLDGLSEEGYL